MRKINNIKTILIAIFVAIFSHSIICNTELIFAQDKIDEHSANNIKYYDSEDCSGKSNSSKRTTHLTGSSAEEKIWNYIIGLGYNDVQAAGVLGNAAIETGFTYNPTILNSYGCLGIFQWCNGQEGIHQKFREVGLEKYIGRSVDVSEIPEDEFDTMLQIELDYVTDPRDNKWMEDLKLGDTPTMSSEIFMVDFERATPYDGCNCSPITTYTPYIGKLYQGQKERNEAAEEAYEKYSGNGTPSSSGGGASNSAAAGDGSNVTIIGDSLTVRSNSFDGSGLKKYLPNADVHAEVGKSMFHNNGSSGGESGAAILKDIVDKDELRDVLVIALGTNDPGAINKDDVQSEIINVASKASKIVLINNAKATNADKYQKNNDAFNEIAKNNSKVYIGDWAKIIDENPNLLDSDKIHPTITEGSDRYGKLIYDSIGAMNGSESENTSTCNCGSGSSESKANVSLTGGLTEEQAQKIANDFNTGDISRWGTPGTTFDITFNCVSFSKYMTNVHTDLTWGGGNGRDIVNNLVAKNSSLEKKTEPEPFSIFSTENHTGFIAAVEGDDVLTIESAWPPVTGHDAIVRHYPKSKYASGYTFVNIGKNINTTSLSEAMGGGTISTNNSGSKAIVDVKWKDGFIESGFEGYVKEALADHKEVTAIDNNWQLNYKTQMPKNGQNGPNKITLHSTEGGIGNSGIAVYNPSEAPLSHFTIDLKNKKCYQHLPITKPASGVADYDLYAGVQIEIAGFSTNSSAGFSDDWYLQNKDVFGDAEWAYLAKLLVAISGETGIPLTTSVDWANPKHVDDDAYKEYKGVLAHMHTPSNDHTDPGDIWGALSEQIAQVENGSTSGDCGGGGSTWQGDFPFLFQCQGEWEFSTFAGGTFCGSGCGNTSAAMIVSALTGKLVTPPDLAAEVNCDTTAMSDPCFRQYAENWDLDYVYITAAENIPRYATNQEIINAVNKYLSDGWIILSDGMITPKEAPYDPVKRTPYSGAGHYVVYYGLDSNGNWLIADPAGPGRPWSANCTDIAQCEPNDNAMEPNSQVDGGIRRQSDGLIILSAYKKK